MCAPDEGVSPFRVFPLIARKRPFGQGGFAR
jgi:hypothetical protein